MDNNKGRTYASVVNSLLERSVVAYKGMLGNFHTKEMDKIVAGFRDGFNTAITHLTNMGVIEVVAAEATPE